MGGRIIDPEQERVPVIAGLPVFDRLGDAADASADKALRLAFHERSRSRLRARLTDGSEVALVLPRGTVLRHGMAVAGASGCLRIEAAQEDLLEAKAPNALMLLRAAYHLGNRHVPVELRTERLLLGYDPVLSDMLVGLGLNVKRVWEAFEPEAGAYGHGH